MGSKADRLSVNRQAPPSVRAGNMAKPFARQSKLLTGEQMKVFLKVLIVIGTCVLSTAANAEFDPAAPTVLITGGNRGIGLEFVNQYAAKGWNVIATARSPKKAEDLQAMVAENDRIVIEQLDVTDHTRIEWLADTYKDQPIDILLSNAGITPKYKSAFKRLSGVDFDMADMSMEVNAIGPLKLAQAFMGHVAASEQKKIIVISSKGGSFGVGPKLPMMYSYRASKAALNMYMYTLAFETPKKGVILTLLSPGQVRTFDLKGMNPPGIIETDESVSKMIKVIDGLTPEQNGQFLDYEDGRVLPW
jgi:NAD(P)-dependent dehydrogenase (short-subunit alcohol dehydrogenase family)